MVTDVGIRARWKWPRTAVAAGDGELVEHPRPEFRGVRRTRTEVVTFHSESGFEVAGDVAAAVAGVLGVSGRKLADARAWLTKPACRPRTRQTTTRGAGGRKLSKDSELYPAQVRFSSPW